MATCIRCGANFNYDKRDGICPKCCFYNRPDGTKSEDLSWLSKYDLDDNKYHAPKMSDASFEEDEPVRPVRGHKELDGSHVHGEDGRIYQGNMDSFKDIMKGKPKGMAGGKKTVNGRRGPKQEEPGKLSKKTQKNAVLICLAVYFVIFLITLFTSLF